MLRSVDQMVISLQVASLISLVAFTIAVSLMSSCFSTMCLDAYLFLFVLSLTSNINHDKGHPLVLHSTIRENFLFHTNATHLNKFQMETSTLNQNKFGTFKMIYCLTCCFTFFLESNCMGQLKSSPTTSRAPWSKFHSCVL